MKVTINIDCTPEEARAFFGLPDVSDAQARIVEELEGRLMQTLKAGDPAELLRLWMSASPFAAAGAGGWQELQKAFWTQMMEAGAKRKPSSDD